MRAGEFRVEDVFRPVAWGGCMVWGSIVGDVSSGYAVELKRAGASVASGRVKHVDFKRGLQRDPDRWGLQLEGPVVDVVKIGDTLLLTPTEG